MGSPLFAGLFLAACFLVDGDPLSQASPGYGYANVRLELEPSTRHLLKAASSDTIFELDSLIIMLSAPEADTQRYAYAVTGRADTGNITVAAKIYELMALRNWKARFYSIDIAPGPVRDTVHIDSVTFGILPRDTTAVVKTVSPAFSILRARFISTEADSIANKVFYLRLRVGGVTRDSVVLGGGNATLNWLQTLSGSVIYAAGDSGRFLRSVTDAQTNDNGAWQEYVLTTNRLVGGYFTSHDNGYVASVTGQVFATTDSGKTWATRATTADSLNALFFTSASTGWGVGQNGGIYKTTNSANSWYGTMVSNTTRHLRGVHFPTSDIGFVVGENETILRTTNGGAGDALPDFGGVVWSPVAGGWFEQTSNTSTNLTDIKFLTSQWGWVVGASGYVRRTVNGGATWLERNGLGVTNPNAIWFSDSTHAYVVGDGGEVSQFQSEWYWAPRTSGTSENLHDVRFVGIDTGYMVGDNGTLLHTVNGSTTSWPYVTWTAQTLPVNNNPGWASKTSGISNALNAVHFESATTGWAVADSGKILKTTDSGNTWTAQTNDKKKALRGVHAHTANIAVAVGDSGIVKRTVNGGGTWTTITSGVTTALNAVAFYTQQIGWTVGASNVIRSTNDSGKTWTSRNSGTGTYNAVSVGNNRIWVVGNSGQIRRSGNLAHNTSFSTVNAGAIGSTDLYGVSFSTGDNGTGYVVGAGGLIAKTTNGSTGNANNVSWTVQSSGTTKTLRFVRFISATVGYVVGDSGVVLKTSDGGTTWILSASGTSQSLYGLNAYDADRLVAVGASGVILKTATAGNVTATTRALRSVYPVTSSTVYVVGDSGMIGKTTNAGNLWTVQTSGTSNGLREVSFIDANTGWAVGNSGTILKTTNGGSTWTAQTSGTTEHLHSVQAISADTAYATGATGIILKTVDGGSVWYQQESPVTEQMNRVLFLSSGEGFAAGNNGKIVNAVNQGDNWTGGGIKRSLKGVFFTSASTGWIVGDDGVILKTTDTGSTWIEQHREEGIQLYGVHFINSSTGWVSGEDGYVLKTTNGGADWVQQSSGTDITLRWVNFRDANRGFIIGGTESILETSNGGTNWSELFVGVPGEREFDRLLTYKRFKPNQSQQVILDAMDRFSTPLRGYQAVIDLTVGAGQDSTLVAPMARCGYDSIPACVP